jgi:Skp family chaperone for outer membrane proteins
MRKYRFSAHKDDFLSSIFVLLLLSSPICAFEFTLPLEVLRNEVSVGVVDIKKVFDAVAKEERDTLMRQKEEIANNLSNIEKEIENIKNEINGIDKTLKDTEGEILELTRKKEDINIKLSSINVTSVEPSSEVSSSTSAAAAESALLRTELEAEMKKIESAIAQKQQEKKELMSKKEEKEQLVRQRQQEMQTKKKEEEDKLLQKEKEITERIYERIYSKIVELAKQENIDIIMDKSLLLYNERVKDLTNTLINMLMLK